jgi:hypothetical protein
MGEWGQLSRQRSERFCVRQTPECPKTKPLDSALSGVDRHYLGVSQSFDVAHRWLSEETATRNPKLHLLRVEDRIAPGKAILFLRS